jgi:nucleotide sugar dehydrogenase
MSERVRHVAVYGLGRVGMPLAAAWLRSGFSVTGVDTNDSLIKRLSSRDFSFIDEPGVAEAFSEHVGSGKLFFSCDGAAASKNASLHLIAVPTPLNKGARRFDSKHLEEAVSVISRGLKSGDVVILESSVPPGTTSGLVKKTLESISGMRADKDFFLAFSPERIYVGRALDDLIKNYPKIVGGVGRDSGLVASGLYSKVVQKGVILVNDSVTAEVVKLFEGVYRDVNIALANELALYCGRLGVDYYEARSAANSQPYSHLHTPGPGVGGMCIPVYPYFVLESADRFGVDLTVVSAARKTNESMPERIVELVLENVGVLGKSIGSAKFVILGAAFRGDTSDSRNSPTHALVYELNKKGVVNVSVHDPYVDSDSVLLGFGIKIEKDLKSVLKDADVVIVAVDHSMYKSLTLECIADFVGKGPLKTLVVDAKGLIEPKSSNGVVYVGLGRRRLG